MIKVEICLDSVESAVAAQQGGADRVELCDNLSQGGTTPSLGMIKQVREQTDLGLMVIVRPRGGDFLYTTAEFDVMRHDMQQLHSLGTDGVVLGCLSSNGTVDKKRTAGLIQLAKAGDRPLSVTFHRAFDMTRDPFEALETLLELGVDRVLTSGQATSAMAGAELIKQLQSAAGDRLTVLPAVGIGANNVAELVAKTAVREVHIGGAVREREKSQMEFQNQLVSMGPNGESEFDVWRTSAEKVQSIVTKLKA